MNDLEKLKRWTGVTDCIKPPKGWPLPLGGTTLANCPACKGKQHRVLK